MGHLDDWLKRIREYPGDRRAAIEKLLSACACLLLAVSMTALGGKAYRNVMGRMAPAQERKPAKRCVVIDAGHGGADPGKVGVNGAWEKDVNLQIALLLKQYLEAADIEAVMTRQTQEGLYDAGASNKKVQDMKRRVALIEEAAPDAVVSIHQNSYPEASVRGSQVFYYNGSQEGRRLAEVIQAQLLEKADGENRRQIKANDSYYLLKKTNAPTVIVECGFLSNAAEAEKLCDKTYQQKLAWAIHFGVLQYLNESQ